MAARTNTRTNTARITALEVALEASAATDARIEASLAALTTVVARLAGDEPAKTSGRKAPKAPVTPERKTKPLTLKAFRAYKGTKAGRKAYAGVSRTDVLEGRAPMLPGFHAPTGERKAAIQAWKAAQEG